MKLELDPDINPSFQTYTCTFETQSNGATEVWACLTGGNVAFGIDQGEDCILLTREELLKMQSLVNHAVEILKAQ